ncbi:hypothetical protein N7535_008194 [Penicillium sp. DV-2018c]|nr:hypothetical protein N7535_008194 [Penicillium sp. DV-2018c]
MSPKKSNRTFLTRIIEAALDREEKGYPPMSAHAATTAAHGFQGNGTDMPPAGPRRVTTTQEESLIPVNDKLLAFRALTGIDSVPALTQAGHLARTAPNVGIYTRVIHSETKAQRAYKLFNFLINTCLGVQIVVAAAVTALGAASGPHSAVTAFGAINTIMAGVLTYLRGSGLPDKLKTYQNQWKNIREYIEQREREFCLIGCTLDVQEEVFIVENMYQSVRSEMDKTRSSDTNLAHQSDDPRARRSALPSCGMADHRCMRQHVDDAPTPSAAQEPVPEKEIH